MTIRRRRKPRSKRKEQAADPVDTSAFLPYLDLYLDWCASRDYSPNTIEGLNERLRRFIRWCIERALQVPQDITRPILERYRRHLFHLRNAKGLPLSFARQRLLLTPLRTFFSYLTRENYILANPASDLELPKPHKKLPMGGLSNEDVDDVIEQTMLHGEIGVRDRAIIETLYSSGIRRSEIIKLTLYDVDTTNGTLMVRQGKENKDRYLPLGARACEWLRRYVEDIRPQLVIEPDTGHLFLHEYGEAFNGSRMSDLVKSYLLAAGIDKVGSCHLFRHAMATQMLDNGADLRTIQVLLGHADISTTQIYTHVAISKLKEIHALTHPAERTMLLRQRPVLQQEHALEVERLLATLATESLEESATLEYSA